MDLANELPSASVSISDLARAKNDDAEDFANEEVESETLEEDEGSPPNQSDRISEKDKHKGDSNDAESVNSLRAMLDSVREENKGLKQTADKLKIALAKAKQELEVSANKLYNLETRLTVSATHVLKDCIRVGRKHIIAEIRRRKAMKKELAMVLKEEEELKRTEEALAADLKRVNVRNASKAAQVQELKRKISRMRRSTVTLEQQGPILEGTGAGTHEAHEAALIFPEEIWMIIFGNLTVWKDIWNCSKACMLFHRKLHSRKTTFLFEQIFPYLFEHLPGHDILKCRSVCKEWNMGVDNFFENHPYVRPQKESRLESLQSPSFLNPMFEKRLGRVYRFSLRVPGYIRQPNCLVGVMATARNPFVSRAFRIELPVGYDWVNEHQNHEDSDDDPDDSDGDPYDSDDDGEDLRFEIDVLLRNQGHRLHADEDGQGRVRRGENQAALQELENGRADEEYFAALYTFLENHGKHIYYLTFKFTGDRENPTDFTIQKMNSFLTFDLFRLVPNLRSICFRSLRNIPITEVGSLPSAPNLETIEFNDMFLGVATAHPLRVALLKKFGRQVKSLSLQSASWTNEMIPVEWTKLTEFHINRIGRDSDLKCLARTKMPQLRRLVLWDLEWKCNSFGDRDDVTIDALLDSVTKLSANTPLDTLQIQGCIQDERLRSLQTDVPKLPMPPTLKTLELKYSPRTCHSFLLRFPFLENLNLFWVGHDPSKWNNDRPVNELVEVNKFVMGGEARRRRGIYKSNIWKMMPRLKLFSYQREAYTRNEYDQYTRRQYDRQLESLSGENSATPTGSAVTETKIETLSNI